MLKRIKRHLRWRIERFYRPNKWHLILDISLITVIVALLAIVAGLYLYNPKVNLPNWIAPVVKPQIDLNNPPLSTEIKTKEEAIYPNTPVAAEIVLKNNGNESIKNLSFNLESLDNNFTVTKIEETSAKDSSLVLKINGTKITIADLPAGATSSKSLKVYFKTNIKNAKLISWQANGEYYFYKQLFKNTIPLTSIKIAAAVQARAAAYYNSPQGDQLGSGPLPPIVGLPTNFWVFFKAEPSGDFNGFIMSAKLPKNVSFTDNYSLLAGNMTYNKDTRQVIWQVDSLTAGASDYRAGFELELIPDSGQLGKNALLAHDIKFQAQDTFSGLKDSGSLNSLDTGLEEDPVNQGDGKVTNE
jgi:hypothetical protein